MIFFSFYQKKKKIWLLGLPLPVLNIQWFSWIPEVTRLMEAAEKTIQVDTADSCVP